jgi:hypothetical protein
MQKSKSALSLLPIPPKMTRYCTLCCKTSPGLDHHCTWLNTCIADINYEAFFYLVIAATLQTVLQAVIGILMATIWFDTIKLQLSPSWHTPMLALLWVHNAIILSLANSYILLAGFHIYLVVIRSGTYDFILENGNDGICARMLKCKCFTKARAKRKSGSQDSKRRNLSKTMPTPASGKVVATPARGSRNDGPTAQDLAASAAKQREREEWKAEWIRKYGADDNEVSSATAAEQPISTLDASKEVVAKPVTPKRKAPHLADAHDQVQIEMSTGVNESEGVIEDIDSGEAAPIPPRASPSPRAVVGAKTEL